MKKIKILLKVATLNAVKNLLGVLMFPRVDTLNVTNSPIGADKTINQTNSDVNFKAVHLYDIDIKVDKIEPQKNIFKFTV